MLLAKFERADFAEGDGLIGRHVVYRAPYCLVNWFEIYNKDEDQLIAWASIVDRGEGFLDLKFPVRPQFRKRGYGRSSSPGFAPYSARMEIRWYVGSSVMICSRRPKRSTFWRGGSSPVCGVAGGAGQLGSASR